MILKHYLILKGESLRRFANRCDVSPATMMRFRNGSIPAKRTLERIHHETGGLVTPNDLTGLYCLKQCLKNDEKGES